jgi:tRNA pseudouridine(55) synthase
MDLLAINNIDYYSIPSEYRLGVNLETYISILKASLSSADLSRPLLLYKPLGITPVELVNLVKSITGSQKASFSSRLDPMAHGIMVVIINDLLDKSKVFNKMNKSYHFKILVGAKTDTGDVLGIFESIGHKILPDLEPTLDILAERSTQIRPHHSSTTVLHTDGRRYPLWYLAKNGVKVVDLPEKECKLLAYKIDSLQIPVDTSNIKLEIIRRINLINPKHTFRQEEIKKQWLNFHGELSMIELTVTVESGFYIRQLVKDISLLLDIPMTIFEIYRNYIEI